MGNSTISLQTVVDQVAGMGDVSPQALPTGYAQNTLLAIADDTMNAFIAKRFNHKFNSVNINPFLTNSWQQDYPQLGVKNIGWIEDGTWIDINNTSLPKPNGDIQAAKDLPVARTSYAGYQGTFPTRVAWMYNRQLIYGAWPGAGSVYTPLITNNVIQNGPTAFIDKNGNILLLTTFGTTGSSQPFAPASSIEGYTVTDGTCVWTVCDPMGQGFRVNNLPGPTGPVYQINAKIQLRAVPFLSINQLLDPIPDDYAHYFRVGYKAGCYAYSSDKATRAEAPQMKLEWLNSMDESTEQGDREPDAFMLIPETRVIAPTWGWSRNPRDPGRPY